uniref:Crystaline entomocidal protoxin n=1 Tax=Bacillus thuringiensis TaxID=1428 RepID=U5KRX2_BACTU|nr:pesticidal protein [Bacillus thuringiensis]
MNCIGGKCMTRNRQDEYEIIDASNCGCASDDVNRYPLASDPNAALQNINYKEYLQMTEGDYTDSNISPSFISGRDVLQTGIDIVGRILGFIGVPFVGQIVGFYTFLLNQLWPTNDNAVWEAFMAQIEELINQRISEAVVGLAADNLTGLHNNYDLYVEALEEWLERPNGARASLVFQRFNVLDGLFTQFMPSFGTGPGSRNYAVPLLNVYTQAANLHLLLLKDAEIYGERWGLNQTQINSFHTRQQNLTRDYTNHCVTTYNSGLDRLRGTNATSWANYHQYRREMTLMVLDLVTLFPYYNVRQYPIGIHPQLTRDIYTEPVLYNRPAGQNLCHPWLTANTNITFSELENAFIRPPHLFDRPENIVISRKRHQSPFNAEHYSDLWSGHRIQSRYVNDSSLHEYSYGENTNLITTINPSSRAINRVDSSIINLRNPFAGVSGVMQASFLPNGGGFTSVVNPPNSGCRDTYDTIDDLPVSTNQEDNHTLSHITFYDFMISGRLDRILAPMYVWTRQDVDLTNTIAADRITQIPLVKASSIAGITVVKGPGFTGGDIIQMFGVNPVFPSNVSTNIRVQSNQSSPQRYHVRIYYACSGSSDLILRLGANNINARIPSTMSPGEPLTYQSFNFRSFNDPVTLAPGSNEFSIFRTSGAAILFIDRIEFIPVNPTREAEEDLENAKKAVSSLFTRTRDGLKVNVTDYQVDQAANLVSCLTDEQYAHDKKMLLEAVRAAKRHSRERNLLQDPDFNAINSTEENGWRASNGIVISEGGPLYKGRSLYLPSANEGYPTYIYQKVDASKLKPYTRYRLDGFVESSQDLEIDLVHHHKVHLVKNVPDNLVFDTYPDGSCSGINRCEEQQLVDVQLDAENHPMDCCEASQTHEFSSYINTGDLNASVDQGVWVIFKVQTTDGYATLGNLELVEAGPLSGESLERAQRENAKWNTGLARKRAETERVYQAAKQSINHLFVDYQDQQLNPDVGMVEITEAQNLVNSITDVYSDVVLQIPGINQEIYTELSNRLQKAWYLYTSRNAVQNGDFNNALDGWHATTDATVQQNGDMYFLNLSHWDAQVSQQFRVQPNCKYVLRVTAEKVGGGDGYVTIRDGAHHQETLTFNACDYDINGTYISDSTYITKEVGFYPETEHMWIEISETEGAFHIDSIEFIETQE